MGLIPLPRRFARILVPLLPSLVLISCAGNNGARFTSSSQTPQTQESSQAADSAQATADAAQSKTHHIRNVFLILMENHNWTGDGSLDIKGNSEAPYINDYLVPHGAHTTKYYNPPRMHPSLPNYLWLEAGTNFGIRSDTEITSETTQSTTLHLVTLLKNAGISWKSYDAWSTGDNCPLGQWHTPFVFFDDVTDHLDPHSQYCIDHIRPLSELPTDLTENKAARYNFIVPSLCQSMHTNCGENQIRAGDNWLKSIVPKILDSSAYKDNGVIFIVWDEAYHGDGPIPMLILSPLAKTNGYTNDGYYDHGSTLRTLEEIFGVEPLMRDAAKQTDLSGFFTVFP